MRRISLALFAVLLLSGCKNDKAEATPPPVQVQAVADRVDVEVTEDGYRPLEVKAKAGQELTMVFTRTSEADCGKKVVVPDFGIERDLPVGKPVEITFTPERTGRIGFMCGMGMMKGAILVQ